MTTTRQLITRAYALAQIIGNGFEEVSGGQMLEGLEVLNELADLKTAVDSKTPYFTEYNFDLGPGLGVNGSSERYFIPLLVQPGTFTFVLGEVRYSLWVQQRQRYQGSVRANTVTTLPGTVFYERTQGGCFLFVYAFPNQIYPATLWGKFKLPAFTFEQVLEDTLEPYFIRYLRYTLAKELADLNNMELEGSKLMEIEKMEKSFPRIEPNDLSIQKIGILSGNRPFINYAQVNIGRGYTAP